MHNTWYA